MRKIILALTTALLLSLPSHAKFRWGVRAGYNLSTLSMNSNLSLKESKGGFFLGAMAKIDFPLDIDLDAAFLYNQRSMMLRTALPTPTETDMAQCITHKSWALPFHLRKGFGLGDKASFFVFAGPQFAFNMGSNVQLQECEWVWAETDVSFNLGIGAMLFNHIELKLNYNIACGKLGEYKTASDIVQGLDNIEGRANSWQIGIGYYF